MTIWQPDLLDRSGPRYRAIAKALDEDIASGRLRPRDRLPTHRDLAWALGMTVGTVSRAYAEAERRGLIVGEVGRGTFVRPATTGGYPNFGDEQLDETIALDNVVPPPLGSTRDFTAALESIAAEPFGETLISYQPRAGHKAFRQAAADWIARSGWRPRPENVVLTVGAQQAILAALAAVTRPGDRVFTEALTYPGVQPAARLLGLKLEGLPIDRAGLIPEALEMAVKAGRGRVLYCIPNLQNPTTAILPPERRREIAAIAERHDMTILEDDVFGFLADDPPPPIAQAAPDRTYFFTSVSKTLAPGLRVGFVAAPPSGLDRVVAAVGASSGMSPPLTIEIVARWIGSGVADRILESRRREAAARRDLVLDCLDGHPLRLPKGSLHFWLSLPDPWRAVDFASAARNRGILVTPAEAFVVEREAAPHAVRVCLGGTADRATLKSALNGLKQLLGSPPISSGMMM